MVRIFVYGTLKRGGCRSHVLRGQQFFGEARTVAKYRMYNTGSYPALVEEEHGLEVEGEVWEVDDDCLRVLDAIEAVPDLYERKPVALTDPSMNAVETYIYRQRVDGMPDCGDRWEHPRNPSHKQGDMEVVYLADLDRPAFDHDRLAVDVVCAGDSITGWNNYGPVNLWPYPTYRQVRSHKRGATAKDVAPILNRLGVVGDNWIDCVKDFGRWFHRAAGRVAALGEEASRAGKRWLQGKRHCRQAFA